MVSRACFAVVNTFFKEGRKREGRREFIFLSLQFPYFLVFLGRSLRESKKINENLCDFVILQTQGVHNMLRLVVCATHMGGFLGSKYSKQGSLFSTNFP